MSELRQRNVPTTSSPTLARPAEGPSDISPAVPASVIIKLLVFVLLLVTVPLGSYFITLNTIFKGKSSYAGALAAFMANAILVGYLVASIWDDDSEGEKEKEQKQQPKEKDGKKFN